MVDAVRDYARWAGRPRKMTDEQVSLAVQLYFQEGMPVREVADAIRVSHMTVWRALSKVTASDVLGEARG
ncbi:Helix-turn-helix domain of resolvase [uncultured archaeon]|nr:Helix-turn-helix domain of resolvase [uncultured archaeon]